MQKIVGSSNATWVYGPLGGAAAAIALAFAYTAVFVVYALIRSLLLVISANPGAGIPGTIVAYAATLSVPALVICVMMSVPAALVGLLTAPLLKRLLSAWNPRHDPARATAIGAAASCGIVVLLHVIFQRALGFSLADVAANPETYLFWLALPSLIYILAGGVAGRVLNHRQREEVTTAPQSQVVPAARQLPHGTVMGGYDD